jgi:uncharacterized membrane protein
MNPFDQVVLLILVIASSVAIGCLLIAWVDIAIHREQKPVRNEQEMCRFMLCGFYCNPEDPRPVVHRPLGRGYTINLRREQLVVTLLVMSALVVIATLIVTLAPTTAIAQ